MTTAVTNKSVAALYALRLDVEEQIADARKELTSSENSGDSAEEIYNRIVVLESEQATLRAAETSIMVAERKRQDAAERLAQWKLIRPKCRQLRNELDALARSYRVAEKASETAQNAANRAEFELDEFNRHRWQPSDYATDAEVAAQVALGADLEAILVAARAALRQANANKYAAQMAALEKIREFDAHAAREVQLRPATIG